ncbi:hypothetical protein M514_25320 [Trichuris suis]|uniref:Reverse transcriptase Ty1/copia-type domain-containing protein n=1 Tax=Trichuris suis TaxID=68888 RepID=A0A085MZ24_9BILA|nr:hypothetical protein M514_25320 [Trichuris suis]
MQTWHRRLGHRDPAAIQKLCSGGIARGVKIKRDAKPFVCTYCPRGKMLQTSFSEGIKRSAKPLDLVHSDLCGPMPTATPAGHLYMLTLIDDHTRFTMVRLIKSKSEADLGHTRVFGAKVFALVADQKRQKWDDEAVEGMLVGYDDPTKGYWILDPETGRTWVSRSVKTIERTERKEDEAVAEQEGEMEKEPTSEDLDDRTFSQLPRLAEHAPQFTEAQHTGQHDVSSRTSPTVSLRHSQRINKGIPPRRLCYQAEIQRKTEPSCWDEMERLLAAEKRKWITAAEEEMNSLRNYQVWELVDLPPGKKTARLEARGFSQKYGRDYDETYAPVVKHETVRALLAIAATRKLHVRHLDVKNAYLNGDLEEELYMEQPPGFVEKGK